MLALELCLPIPSQFLNSLNQRIPITTSAQIRTTTSSDPHQPPEPKPSGILKLQKAERERRAAISRKEFSELVQESLKGTKNLRQAEQSCHKVVFSIVREVIYCICSEQNKTDTSTYCESGTYTFIKSPSIFALPHRLFDELGVGRISQQPILLL
ncbi:hypothetical protein EV361DRAFT_62550 [Lentinula raphanica]|nr:hypothetical protein EV361DRAFT_62550 [Lentinula raphanica]